METETPRRLRAACNGVCAAAAECNHLGNLIARNAHLHRTHCNLEGLLVDLPLHDRCLARCQRAQLHRIARCHMANHMRLRVHIALVRACVLRYDRGIEALGELPPQSRDAPLGVLGKLLLRRAVVDGPDRLPCLVFEVLQQRLQFLLHLADLGAPLLHAFGFEPRALTRSARSSSCCNPLPFRRRRRELLVQAVEKAPDVQGLRAQPRTRAVDNARRSDPAAAAMLMPAEAPGTPCRSSYVGASVCSSKPTAALMHAGVFSA